MKRVLTVVLLLGGASNSYASAVLLQRSVYQMSFCRALHLACRDLQQFERPLMLTDYDGVKVAGYYASSKNPSEDCYKGRFGWPEAHPEPAQGQELLVSRLFALEKKLLSLEGTMNRESANGVISYRGLSKSRLQEGLDVGNKEFVCTHPVTNQKVKWSEALRWHYLKHNVRVPQEFSEFVMNNPWVAHINEILPDRYKSLSKSE